MSSNKLIDNLIPLDDCNSALVQEDSNTLLIALHRVLACLGFRLEAVEADIHSLYSIRWVEPQSGVHYIEITNLISVLRDLSGQMTNQQKSRASCMLMDVTLLRVLLSKNNLIDLQEELNFSLRPDSYVSACFITEMKPNHPTMTLCPFPFVALNDESPVIDNTVRR